MHARESGTQAKDNKTVVRTAKRAVLVVGGCIGSAIGVIGASISDPRVGFPAWVDLTGVVAGFGLGVLAAGIVVLFRRALGSLRDGRSSPTV